MHKPTQDEIETILESHHKWRQAKKGGVKANFSNMDLTNANLSGFNLSGLDFIGSNLTNANLFGCFLINTNLTSADLNCARLYGVDFREVHSIKYCNFKDADLTGAEFDESMFDGTQTF